MYDDYSFNIVVEVTEYFLFQDTEIHRRKFKVNIIFW